MKFISICAVLLCAYPVSLLACDACSVGGSGLGILTGFRYNYANLSYQHATYTASPGAGTAKDAFQTMSLNIRYYLARRLAVQVNQSYAWNQRDSEIGRQSINGFADSRLATIYTVHQNDNVETGTGLHVEAGLGLKLPTGRFVEDTHEENLPENFSPGQGNFGILFQPAVVLSVRSWGVAVSGVALYQFKSSNDYRYGHQASLQAFTYYDWELSPVISVTPFVGSLVEVFGSDEYASGIPVHGTGGEGLIGVAGVNTRIQDFIVGVSAGLPLFQSYSDNEVDARSRVMVQVSYTF